MAMIALTALAIGLLLLLAGKSARQRRGLTDAPTLELDDRVLYSARLGLWPFDRSHSFSSSPIRRMCGV